jgi:phosphohistidine phosphatase
MRLYFLRHGRAVSRRDWSGADVERPLSEEGVELVRAEAQGIHRMGLDPALIMTSPLVRAAQTAEIVAEHLDMRGRLLHEERLEPGFGLEQLEQILRENDHAGSILFVGHEPDLSQTISDITGGSRIVCKKGSLARVDLPDHSVRRGELVWLIPSAPLAI